MSDIKLIGLSGKIASGKSTIAHHLGEHYLHDDYHVVSYADSLKEEADIVIKIIQENKLLPHIIHHSFFKGIPDDKTITAVNILLDDVKKGIITNSRQRTESTRKFLQYWGTEVRRAQDDNYWIKAFNNKIQPLLDNGSYVIVDDVRFVNEADNILDNNGFLIRLSVNDFIREKRLSSRDGNTVSIHSDHPSEVSLDKYTKFSLVYDIHDNDTVDSICQDILQFII